MTTPEELTLGIPEAEGEPRPWTVSVWRYHVEEREPFVDRSEAVDYARALSDGDGCYVEGVYNPAGKLDVDATLEAIPFLRRSDLERQAARD